MVVGLKNSGSKFHKKWIITFFCVFFASTFNKNTIGDGIRHWAAVEDYYVGLSFEQFFSDLVDIVTFKTNLDVNEDVYIHVISYLTGSILGFPGLFFTVVGFIYGYFFSSSILKVFDVFPSWRRHTTVFILAVYFILILNIQSMNTVRTWTGFWIMFYGVLQYLDAKKLKYLILAFSAPLFHFGYFIMALPVWLGLLTRIPKIVVVGIYTISFTTNFFSLELVEKQLAQFEVGQEKTDAYAVEEKAGIDDRVKALDGKRWYLTYKKSGIVQWAIVGIVAVLLLNGDYFRKMNNPESILFTIGLLEKAFSNTTWFLFAVSNRSDVIASHFILASLLLYWQRIHQNGFALKLKPYLNPPWYIACILILLVYFFYASNILEYTSVFTLISPYMVWFDQSMAITLRGLIGYLLGI